MRHFYFMAFIWEQWIQEFALTDLGIPIHWQSRTMGGAVIVIALWHSLGFAERNRRESQLSCKTRDSEENFSSLSLVCILGTV